MQCMSPAKPGHYLLLLDSHNLGNNKSHAEKPVYRRIGGRGLHVLEHLPTHLATTDHKSIM